MKGCKFKWLLFLLFIICSNSILGQENEAIDYQTKNKDSSYFSVGLNFISDAVFAGRKDSITAPYLYPSLSYYNKSGIYATGSFSYLTRPNESRIDLFLGTLGYEFSIKKFEGDISFTKYFFNSDSYNVISEVEADVTGSFRYDFKVINLVASAISFFNNNSDADILLSSEISHDFVTKNQKFQISPTIGAYFGSQNFYEQYYINNRFGSGRGTGNRQGSSNGQGSQQGTSDTSQTALVLNESEKFNLLAIEFSVPIWYVSKPVIIAFLPVLAIPQNPATLTVNDVVFEEDLETTFYWIIGMAYSF